MTFYNQTLISFKLCAFIMYFTVQCFFVFIYLFIYLFFPLLWLANAASNVQWNHSIVSGHIYREIEKQTAVFIEVALQLKNVKIILLTTRTLVFFLVGLNVPGIMIFPLLIKFLNYVSGSVSLPHVMSHENKDRITAMRQIIKSRVTINYYKWNCFIFLLHKWNNPWLLVSYKVVYGSV